MWICIVVNIVLSAQQSMTALLLIIYGKSIQYWPAVVLTGAAVQGGTGQFKLWHEKEMFLFSLSV